MSEHTTESVDPADVEVDPRALVALADAADDAAALPAPYGVSLGEIDDVQEDFSDTRDVDPRDPDPTTAEEA